MDWRKITATATGGLVLLGICLWIAVNRFDVNHFKPEIEEIVYNATGRRLALTGDIDLKIGFHPWLVARQVRLENTEWGSRPDLAVIERLEIEVSLIPLLRRKIEVSRLLLVDPDILLETDGDGVLNLGPIRADKVAGDKSVSGSLPFPSLHNIDIQNGRIAYRDGRTSASHTMAVKILTASRTHEGDRMKIMLKGAYNDHPLEIIGSVGGLRRLLDADLDWPVDLTAKTQGWTMDVQGTVRDVMGLTEGDLAITVSGEPGVVSGIGAIAVDADVDIADIRTYRFSDLNAVIGESDLHLSGTLTLSDKRPRLTATISSNKLDLRPITFIAGIGASPSALEQPSSGKRVFSTVPLRFDALRQLDADLEFHLAALLTKEAAFTGLGGNIRLENGRLGMKPFSATIGGSALTATLEINAAAWTPTFSGTLQVKRLNLGKMFDVLDIRNAVTGMGNLEANLMGRGKSIAEVMGSLNGNTVFALQKGFINLQYLQFISLDFTAALVDRIFSLLGVPSGGRAEIQCLFGRLDITNGVVDVSPLVIKTPETTVFGTGGINLKTERLDLSISTEPTRGTDVIRFTMGQLTRIFRLTGTLARPTLSIDPFAGATLLVRALSGPAMAGTLLAMEALLESKDVRDNPCLQMTASPVNPSSVLKAVEPLKEKIEDAGESILNIFRNR